MHSNTVSKTKNANSNLIQIVSRGNFFGGFLTLHIEDNYIEIKHFNEIGPDLRFNNDFVEDGILKIWKADPANVVIESSGELLILDDEVALLEFGFESITPMGGTRQVLGLRTDEDRIAPWVVMGGANCTEALENVGSFGAQYDAQVANLVLFSPGRDGTGYAGVFSSDTSFGIYGTGPPTHGEIVSVEMWIKTSAGTNSEMVLASYFAYWGFGHDKDHLLLTLDKGIPTFYLRKKQAHKASIADPLTDDAWHHIVLTMPGKSCRSSEMILYVDGDRVELISSVSGEKDRHIFFGTNGRMGFGGFGYAFIKAKDYYSGMVNYEGLMDDVKVYSRTIAP